ncbi:MAG TPA: tRNA (adenosine(37)-N6)-threonylcarbamoyltransferase complex dimerization subunit type 1 TsaB [Lacisediminihabitans sp.]|nr:tRNA (adenosine(37)-N6)-threonylcarbamoyltransferase complex dimerization subunit type 1 TsaB [Lacisediminihabitans sp.]HXD60791.1 tRNA (adenosine(37)-N6)-threonylcarbamoyltransferase complex dimerization subunit type 1 TsaB [Lacisediminihabitans sp.]
MLLAIDTSAGTSVAVVDRDRGVLAERAEPDTRRHAEVIGELIAQCLHEAQVPVTALSGVAVGMGPGPFTGLRVGIAAAQAFALGAAKPVVRLVSHDAIAFERYATGASGPLLVVTDARRREVYWSAYSGSDELGLPVRASAPGLTRPDELSAAVPNVGDYERFDASAVSAASLGLLAESMYLHGRAFAGTDALYLRSPDVTLSSGPKRVTG